MNRVAIAIMRRQPSPAAIPIIAPGGKPLWLEGLIVVVVF
jgi:hypothetical protein